MVDSLQLIRAEIFLLRKRTSTWVLLGIWTVLGLFFGYVLPYLSMSEGSAIGADRFAGQLAALLPDQLVATIIGGFPFYGGAIALMLGVMTVGSEFGWGTLKTLFTQRPGRGNVFAAKMGALGLMLLPFVLLVFVVGLGASTFIAWQEEATIVWPDAMEVVRALLAGWLILAVCASLGVLLAVATRGTSLAIGIGILYSLVIEGLISAFANQIDLLQPLIDGFLRANAYSLVRPLGGIADEVGEGPGVFSGPFVDEVQALAVLLGYLVIFLVGSAWILRRRDVV